MGFFVTSQPDYYWRNRERLCEYQRLRRLEHRKRNPLVPRVKKTRKAVVTDWRKKCLDQGLCPYCGQPWAPGLKICATHRQLQLDANYAYRDRLRKEVFDAYGGKCVCCGESNYRFLTIDHPNNDGAKHRRETGCGTGIKFYLWLRKHGYPKEFDPLCWNCNCGKSDNLGVCPHKAA